MKALKGALHAQNVSHHERVCGYTIYGVYQKLVDTSPQGNQRTEENKGASQSSNDMLAEAADRQCSTGREQESIAVIAPSSHVR